MSNDFKREAHWAARCDIIDGKKHFPRRFVCKTFKTKYHAIITRKDFFHKYFLKEFTI